MRQSSFIKHCLPKWHRLRPAAAGGADVSLIRLAGCAGALLLFVSCKDGPTAWDSGSKARLPVAKAPWTPPKLPDNLEKFSDDVTDLVVSGEPSATVEREGKTTYFYGGLFLGPVGRAPVVTLVLEGVTLEPGSEAEVYLADPGLETFKPSDFIGSVSTVAGDAAIVPIVLREVHDFEAGGKQFTARSSLQQQAHFSLAMVVKRGHVSVNRFILTARGSKAP